MIRTSSSALLLDVGGTFIKACFLPNPTTNENGVISEFAIDSNGTCEEIFHSFNVVQKWAESLSKRCGLKIGSVAVAIPGPFDYRHGVFLMKHKFQSVYGMNFSKFVHFDDCDVEYRFVHDVNCMLLGEVSNADMAAFRNVALVTLGTGLGFSMSLNGEILVNENGSPLRSIYNLPCGNATLEDYVSKRGFISLYRSFSGDDDPFLTVKDIAIRAFEGDELSKDTFAQVARVLSVHLKPILKENEIEALFFGGQISRSFSLMEPALREELQDVKTLERISAVSDISNATFRGLRSLLLRE